MQKLFGAEGHFAFVGRIHYDMGTKVEASIAKSTRKRNLP
jgi:hypothetical protein